MYVVPPSVLKIPSMPREEGGLSMRIFIHVTMVTAPIIWYQIGDSAMLPLTIQKPLQPLQLLMIPQVSPIQPRRASPSQSRHKAEESRGIHKGFYHNGGPHGPYHQTICPPGCVCPQKGVQGVYKIFNLDGSSLAPIIDSVDQSTKDVLAVYRFIL